MDRPAGAASLSQLTPEDLDSLRLAAQVMSHRAMLAGTSAAVLYFDSLAAAVDGEQAARAQTSAGTAQGRVMPMADGALLTPLMLGGARGADDRRIVGEYLALLADNERLPAHVRDVCRALEISFRQ